MRYKNQENPRDVVAPVAATIFIGTDRQRAGASMPPRTDDRRPGKTLATLFPSRTDWTGCGLDGNDKLNFHCHLKKNVIPAKAGIQSLDRPCIHGVNL
jgi:hypothetical protein